MTAYNVPGVYVEEIPSFPPAVAAVETAIPAFIGHTGRTPADGITGPRRIGSLLEFEELFGRGKPTKISGITVDEAGQFVSANLSQEYYLYPAVQLYYANGGGDCYIVSVGDLNTVPDKDSLIKGITDLQTYDEPTILVIPDAAALSGGPPNPIYAVQDAALLHCAALKDRVAVLDTLADATDGKDFRNNTGIVGLKYGVAYTPWLHAALPKYHTIALLNTGAPFNGGTTLATLMAEHGETALLTPEAIAGDAGAVATLIKDSSIIKGLLRGLDATAVPIPPSGAVAGVYARTDRERGVWKAPANESVLGISGLSKQFKRSQLGELNEDVTSGKSINAIRHFSGRGFLIYGGRTLAGNSAEDRYVSVRRLMNMLEESIAKATEQFVFDPNDANTWVRVRGMIENFLTLLWRDGALQGAKPEHAFRVAVGLGSTMTADDVINGRMIIDVAVAPVRPAEFIILRFKQQLPTS